MRKSIILLCSAFIISIFSFATTPPQNRRMNLEEFERRKMEYVKAAAELTQAEADKFFPLNRELSRKRLELSINHHRKVEEMEANRASMTSEEFYSLLLESNAELRQKQLALEILYVEKFKEVLSPEKLHNAQRAEERFQQRELANFRAQQEQLEE